MPKIAVCGALRMGVDNNDPKIPPLETVKVPPCISSIDNFPSLAFSAYSEIDFSISEIDFMSASLITGTTSPLSVETATPISL